MNIIDQFFNRYLIKENLDPATKYVDSYHFEMKESISNELLNMVISGQKKATSASYEIYKLGIQVLPKV